MFAIFKKELYSYFTSAIGYVVLSIFLLFSGFYFYVTCLITNSADISYIFSNLFNIVVFLVPILTMRLISEEKKQKTDQLLFTAPVTFTNVVLGKYFSALLVILFCESVTFLYSFILAFFTKMNYGIFFGNFLGLFLLASALVSMGIFFSAITENQIVAAVLTFTVGVFILLLDSIARFINFFLISDVLTKISFVQKYNNFTSGIFSLPDVVFFVSVITVFLIFTINVLKCRK